MQFSMCEEQDQGWKVIQGTNHIDFMWSNMYWYNEETHRRCSSRSRRRTYSRYRRNRRFELLLKPLACDSTRFEWIKKEKREKEIRIEKIEDEKKIGEIMYQ